MDAERLEGEKAGAIPPRGLEVVAGFENTYFPLFGIDSFDLTGHAEHWRSDLDDTLAAGVRYLRYPIRWHYVEREPGTFDWSEPDEALGYLRDRGGIVILDLLHHTSYPDWLSDGLRDSRFGPAFVRFATAVAERYPWLQAYTLLNEPFVTLFLTGRQALWPPFDTGEEGFVRLLKSVLPGLCEASAIWRDRLPHALHVWVDTAEHHTGVGQPALYADECNDRRFVVLDLVTGHDLNPDRPYLGRLLREGADSLLGLDKVQIDILGLDYYPHSEWFYDDVSGHSPSPYPVGFAAIAEEYHRRYRLPMMLTETNIRGLPSDRVSWLKHMVEQYELAWSRGVPMHGFCWYPQVDSCDWDSMLGIARGRPDPVGVVSLAPDGNRKRTVFTGAWEKLIREKRAAALPAYRLQAPNDTQLAGYLPLMSHWHWQDPPVEEQTPPNFIDDAVTRQISTEGRIA